MQATLEDAIETVTREAARVVGSGRTDAGAHAHGQVIAFSTECGMSPEMLLGALNGTLPKDIAVTDLAQAPPDFHPRFDAVGRVYQYRIWNRRTRSPFWQTRAAHVIAQLDTEAMHHTVGYLVGRRDFGAFVPAHITESKIREIFRAACWRDGDLVCIELEANGFMRQMVRAIAGTLILVGLGRLTEHAFRQILASNDRNLAGETAPAHGLYLMRVLYPDSAGEATVSGLDLMHSFEEHL